VTQMAKDEGLNL